MLPANVARSEIINAMKSEDCFLPVL